MPKSPQRRPHFETLERRELLAILAVNDVSVTEGSNAQFRVDIYSASGTDITLSYQTFDDTALAGSDYSATTSSVILNFSGDSSYYITVPTTPDSSDEGDETFSLSISAAGHTVSTAIGIGTILDDDSAPSGAPSVSVGDIHVDEGDMASFTVSLSWSTSIDVTVDYSTSNGTASDSSDYTSTSGAVVISAGQTTATVTVSTNGDSDDEGDETFTLQLSNPSSGTIGDGSGIATIDDDDGPGGGGFTPEVIVTKTEDLGEAYAGNGGHYSFERNGDTSSELTVTFAFSGDAVYGSDWTVDGGGPAPSTVVFGVGEAYAYLYVYAIDDDEALEDTEYVILTLQDGADYNLSSIESFYLNWTAIFDDEADPVDNYVNCNCACSCETVQASPSSGTNQNLTRLRAGSDVEIVNNSFDREVVVLSADIPFKPDWKYYDYLKAYATFHGSTNSDPVYFDPSELVAGEDYTFAFEMDLSSVSAGIYTYSITVEGHWALGPTYETVDRKIYVEGLDDMGFGPGMQLASLDRLMVESTGAYLKGGNGNRQWFDKNSTIYAADGGNRNNLSLVKDGSVYKIADRFGDVREFNSLGLMTKVTDRNGNSTLYNYTDADSDSEVDDLTTMVDQVGKSVSFTYTSGHISSFVDRRNKTYSLAYNSAGFLESLTEPDPDDAGPLAAPQTSFTYIGNKLETFKNAKNEVTSFTYGPMGTLSSKRGPTNIIENYSSYLTKGIIDTGVIGGTSLSLAPLQRTSLLKNSSIENPDAGTATTKQNRFGDIISYVDDDDNQTLFDRDGKGRITRRVDPDPDGNGPLTRPITTYTYDSYGNPTEIEYPDGSTESWTWHSTFDLPLSHTDKNGNLTLFTYDSMGDVLFRRQVIGGVDGVGNSETDDVIYGYTYTNAPSSPGDLPGGLLLTETNPLGRVTEYDYTSTALVNKITYAVSTAVEAFVSFTYDAADRMIESIDELGRITEFEYDDLDRLVRKILPDPDGAGVLTSPEHEYEYDSVGRLVTEIDPLNRQTSYTYDAKGQLIKIERPDHDGDTELTTTEYGYDDAGRQITVTDPLGRITSSTYNTLGQLVSQLLPDPDGVGGQSAPATSYTYDALGRTLTVKDALENITSYSYENFGRIVTVTQPDPDDAGPLASPVTSMTYDALGKLLSAEDALGRVTSYEYDELGRKVRQTLPDPDGAGPLTAPVTEYEYDKVGNLRFVTDPLGNVTEYQYDARNRLVLTILPDPDDAGPLAAPETESEFDDAGQLLSSTDALGRVTSYTYDGLGRVTKITQPDPDGVGGAAAPETSYTYDAASRRTGMTDARGKVTSYDYDLLDNLVEQTAPDPDGAGPLAAPVSTWEYDAAGQLLSSIDPENRETTYEYDGLGRQQIVTQPDPDGVGGVSASETSYSYDAVGNLLEATDPNGKVTTYTYDNLYRIVEEQQPDPDGVGALGRPTTSYTYDAVGNRLSLTDPVGNTTIWTYDDLNRQLTDANELSQSRSFAYDSVGNLVERTDRNGRVIEYVYDNLYRRTEENWLDGSSSVIWTMAMEYDAVGQLLSASDPSAAYEYEYDDLGRNIEETQSITGLSPVVTFNRGYDANGNRTSLSAKINSTLDYLNSYTFDYLNRVTQITQAAQGGGNAVAEKRFNFAYNAAGQFTSINRYADVAGTEFVAESSYDYDDMGRLTSLQHAQGMSSLAGYSYSYDAASRITAINSVVDGLTTYTNDHTGQLTGADHTGQTDESYSYDENGNRANYTIDDNNQIQSDGTFDYEYDDEGNRTAKETISTGERVEYTWDHRNRLVNITFKNALGAVVKTVAQSYDVFNQWVGSEFDSNGATSGGVSNRFFVHDAGQIVLEFDGTAASDVSHRYSWGPMVDQILADEQVSSVGSAGNVIWPLTDHLNTTRDLVSYNSGTNVASVANHRRFDSFGNVISETNSAVDLLFGFTGRAYDENSGLQNNLNRWYDPVVGQWMSEDPIGFEASDGNIRRYASNSVIESTDPDGLKSAAQWRQQALQSVGYKESGQNDPVELNRRITAAYAEMFMRDPKVNLWAGMAAYASKLVGESIALAGKYISAENVCATFITPIYVWGYSFLPTPTHVHDALKKGNFAVFNDIYWQFLAYSSGGLSEMEDLHTQGDLELTQIEAWRLIDKGKKTNDSDKIWKGNKLLLEYEQSVTLQQGIYDKFPETFFRVTQYGQLAGMMVSPIPGDKSQLCGASIGNFDERWRWIETGMLPAYQDLLNNNFELVSGHMAEFMRLGGIAK